MEENNSWIETISSPWREKLVTALKQIQRKLFIVSPYIKKEIAQQIQEALLLREAPFPIEIQIITRSLPEEFVSESSDVEALQQICKWNRDIKDCHVEIRIINNVHAKIWIFDTQLAIVGSGNATSPGLDTNVEYELAVTHPSTIEKIQQDWQSLWEYAEPITETQLATIAEWVHKVQIASIPLEKETQKQRQAIEKEIGKAPKLGKRYTVRTTKNVVVQRRLFDKPVEEPLPPETVQAISIAQLQQALWWIFPRTDDWTTYIDPTEPLFIKITWIAQPTAQYLQLNWADGKRLSQATVAGQSANTTQNWSISIHFQQIGTLLEILQSIQTPQHNYQAGNGEINLLRSTEGTAEQLYIASTNRTFNMKKPTLIGTPTTIPMPFTALKPPVSSIIIEHTQFIAVLHQLEEQWYSFHEKQEDSARTCGTDSVPLNKQKYHPATLNLRLDTPGEHSSIQLSLESSAVRAEMDLPGTHCILIGPAIVITLDYKALWQALIGTQNVINTWKLCIDANVDSLQLVSETPKDSMLSTWRHELRHVEV